ncbi:MAG: hypothetical protein IJ242_12435 [Clostridia bacterium]|nr:hypothetical protein [Clostridia bacterium]
MKACRYCLLLFLLFSLCACAGLTENRILLIACREFETLPSLGESASANLNLLRSTFLNAGIENTGISVEDGTLGSIEALQASIDVAFSSAKEDDLSILYICTHGFDRRNDIPAHLVLSDGQQETRLEASVLFSLLEPIQGDVLLLLDACHSGAFISRGIHEPPLLSLPDNIHVLTSSLATESAWYYAHNRMSSGAISYFTNALCTGLGLYGQLSADTNGDDTVSLTELTTWIRRTVASSTCQSYSSRPSTFSIPHCSTETSETKPISGFSCGSQLISDTNTAFHFSFNVSREARIEYHLVSFEDNHWNWANPIVIQDIESTGYTGRGGKTRTLSIDPANREKNGYLIFQVFAFEADQTPQLCAERLLAIQATGNSEPTFSLDADRAETTSREMPVLLHSSMPTIFRLSILNESGDEIRRLYYGELTRPSVEDTQYLYWDLKDENGNLVPAGHYTADAMFLCSDRRIESSLQLDLTDTPTTP